MKRSDRNSARRSLHARNRRFIRGSGRKLKHAIAVLASVIVLGTVLLLVSVANEQREAAEERAWNDVDNLAGAFEEQVSRVLESVEGAVALLKSELAAKGASFDLVDWASRVPAFATSTVQIALVGPDGKLFASSLASKPKAIDLADREHIRVHLSGGVKSLFIGKPVVGRVSGQPTIQITGRFEDAQNKLAGIIVFSLSPEFLTTLHRAVNLGRTGSMILLGQDGVVRASYAAWQKSDLEFIGAKVEEIANAGGASEFHYRGKNPLSGEPAFVHWQQVRNHPLIVMVSFGDSEVFAVADRSAAMLAMLGAGVLLMTVTTTLILYREITRRVNREVALFDEGRKLVLVNDNLHRRHHMLLATSAELAAERTRLQIFNKELNEAKERADQASQAKTSLLMNMSHEFRTPMHAILNYTNMGMKKLEAAEPEKLKKYLTNIQASGLRLLELLNALLDLAKLESGKFELKLTQGDLIQVIRQSQIELGSLFEAKRLAVIIMNRSTSSAGVFDVARMTQVFINLLSNAIKFSPYGALIEIAITDSALADGRAALHCIVSDNGVGIPEAEIETIFEKFTQSSKTDTGAGGSGLGLAICREIIHLHGGAIWAAASPSGGAMIHFTIPAARAQCLTRDFDRPSDGEPAEVGRAQASAHWDAAGHAQQQGAEPYHAVADERLAPLSHAARH